MKPSVVSIINSYIHFTSVKCLSLCLILLFIQPCKAENLVSCDSSLRRTNVILSYNTSLIYPGLTTGIEYCMRNSYNDSIYTKKSGIKYSRKRLIAGSLNWYHHPSFHDNIYFTAEWVMRRIRNSGFISEFSAGPGYSRTFLGGTTYRVDEKGMVTIKRNAGYSYALITIGGGFGYDFYQQKKIPLSALAKMNIISMFPYNSTFYFRPVLNIGIRYTPGWSYIKKTHLHDRD